MRYFYLFFLLPQLLCSQTPGSPERQSYLAHIAAANSAMRLNSPLEMQRWLEAAPEKQRGWEWRFLKKNSDVSLQTHRFEGEKPNNFAISPDGKMLALPMPDGKTELRDAQSFQLKNTLVSHQKTIYAAVFNPFFDEIATVSRDSSIRCWDLKNGREIWSVPSGGHGLATLAISPKGSMLAFASWFRMPERGVMGLVRLLDARTGKEIWRTEFGVKPILGLAFSDDGLRLAIGNWDGQVAVWSLNKLADQPQVFNFEGCQGYTACDDLAFSPDGKTVLAASKCANPRAWNVETGQQTLELRGHNQAVMAVNFSRDGRHIFTGGDEGVLHVWDAATGKFLAKQFGHSGRISRIATLPGGREILTLSDDKTIRRWQIRNSLNFDDPKGRGKECYAFDLTRDGKTLGFGAGDGQVSLWVMAADSLKKLVKCFDSAPNALAFNPDGSQFVAVNWGKTVKIWDSNSGQAVRELKGLEGGSSGCAWSPDGRIVAAASTKNFVFIWEASTGQLIQKLERGAGSYSVKFSPDGKHLVAAGNDGKITVWAVPDGSDFGSFSNFRKLAEWQAHQKDATIYSLAFSPDGKYIVSGAEDRVAVVSEFSGGKILQKLEGHAQRIWSVAWSPDGSRIATASADLTVCLWDAKTADRTLMISGREIVYNLVFSPDGVVLLGNEMNGKVQVFRAD